MGKEEGKFQVMLEGEFYDYPDLANRKIYAAWKNGEEKVDFKLKVGGKEAAYVLNFKTMKQTAAYSSKEREVRAPFDMMAAVLGAEEAAAAKLAEAGALAGDDVKQEYAVNSKEDAAAKKKREARMAAIANLQKLLEVTANTKGWEEEKLVQHRSMMAKAAKEGDAAGLGQIELKPAQDRIRKLHNAIQDLKGAIRVFARTRPFNQREIDTGSKYAVDFRPDQMTVKVEDNEGKTNQYLYDTTFNPGKQEDIFAELEPLCQSSVDGYNVTVFAYGQTGSGKTYTMYGPKDNPGVVPRACNRVFEITKEISDHFDCVVSCQMMELYNGHFSDLLYRGKEKPPQIEIRKGPDGTVIANGCSEKVCKSGQEVVDYIVGGFDGRKTAATAMNADSSRSHLFAVIKIQSINKETKKRTDGKLTLVDLAGSEKVKDSMVEGQALAEAIEINKSLTTLGDVMSDLTSGGGKKANFRNAPLTNFLQDSLGGTAKTLMFAGLSPAMINVTETNATCAWAMRARKVVNDGGKAAIEKAAAKATAAGSKAKAKPKTKTAGR